jgi:hypothetical protein
MTSLNTNNFDLAQANKNIDDVHAMIADNHSYLSLNDIVTERKAWEDGVYRTSNQQLYAILAKCLNFYNVLSASKTKDAEARKTFDSFVASNDIKFKAKTHLMHKVVKCVFYEPDLDRNAQRDRRRISAYSIVLQRALEDNISADALADFIEQKGGIEQIRLNKKDKVSMTDKAEQSRQAVESSSNYLAVISDHSLMSQFDASDYDKAFVAVVVPRGEGRLELRQIIKNTSAVNSSLASIYAETVLANSSETVSA